MVAGVIACFIICVVFVATSGVCAFGSGEAKPPAAASSDAAQKAGKPARGSCRVSSTTSWRQISGWERDVIKRDPNLGHWNWIPMQEMNKSYIRLAPGKVPLQGSYPSQRHYVKPIHSATPRHGNRRPPVLITARDPGQSYYVKPVHIPTTITNTKAQLNVPRVNLSLAAPGTRIGLRAPGTGIRLAVPQTRASLGAPQTHVRLSAPQTRIQLAAPETQARLAVRQTGAQLVSKSTSAVLREQKTQAALRASPAAGVFAPANNEDDAFSAPGRHAYSPYGLARGTASGSSAVTEVKGRVLINHEGPK